METQTNMRAQVLAAAFFVVTSITMMLINKAAIRLYPFAAFLLCMQTFASVVLALGSELLRGAWRRVFDPFASRAAIVWLPAAVLFCFNLLSSLQALKFVSVATFSVIRNTIPLFTAACDLVFYKRSTSRGAVGALLVALLGAIRYASDDLEYNFAGYAWSLVHVTSMTCYLVLVKRLSEREEYGFTPNTMSLYNNAESLPMFFVLAWTGAMERLESSPAAGGAEALPSNFIVSAMNSLSMDNIPVIVISCLAGYALSISAFMAQRNFSATAFITLNNVAKIPALLVSFAIFGGKRSPAMVQGMAISLTGAYAFSLLSKNGIPPAMLRLVDAVKARYRSVYTELPTVDEEDGTPARKPTFAVTSEELLQLAPMLSFASGLVLLVFFAST